MSHTFIECNLIPPCIYRQKALGGHLVAAGIPETKSENTTEIVKKILEIANVKVSTDISLRSFRMGLPQKGKNRPIRCIFGDIFIANQLVDFSRKTRPTAKMLCDNFKAE